MIFRELNAGPCKTYLLASPKSKEAMLVDPLLEKADDYLELLKSEGLRLSHVIDTHTHADHLSAGLALRDKASVPYVMHTNSRVACVTKKVEDGETLGAGDLRVTFLHTPGHTSDSLSLILKDRILSGDFLFIGSLGAGRLDLPGSDPSVHFDSLKKLDSLPDSMFMSPAHDYQGASESSLGAERRLNPVLTPRGRDEYVRWWNQKKFGAADWMKAVVKTNLAGTLDPRAVPIPKEAAACACASGPSAEEESLPHISASDLARNLARKEPLVLLDVRTAEEYSGELGHIAGAVLIPVDELEARIKEVPPGKVVSICRSGKRAARAAAMLKRAGKDQVWVLTGGMLAWNDFSSLK